MAARAPPFTPPTDRRFVTLRLAAVRTTGRRTGAHRLRTRGGLVPGHRPASQRVLCRAPGSALKLGGAWAGLLRRPGVPDHTVVLVGDDTGDGHPGPKGDGPARPRDPIRSPRRPTAGRDGHPGVGRAGLGRFPWAPRPWALPVRVTGLGAWRTTAAASGPTRTPAPRRGAGGGG